MCVTERVLSAPVTVSFRYSDSPLPVLKMKIWVSLRVSSLPAASVPALVAGAPLSSMTRVPVPSGEAGSPIWLHAARLIIVSAVREKSTFFFIIVYLKGWKVRIWD